MTEIRQAQPLTFPDTDQLRYLPEGPVPLADGLISWVAIQHGGDAKTGSLNVLDLKTVENRSYELPGRPGFAYPCQRENLFVVGCERSLGLFDTSTGNWEPFYEGVDGAIENTIINDGLVYEHTLIFGTKDLEFATKKASLYAYHGDQQRMVQLRDDQICSNGKGILRAEDGKLQLLDIDSPTRQLVAYDIEIPLGRFGAPRVVIDFAGDPAVPDGAIVTPDQKGVIVAMFRPEIADHGETRLYDLETGQLRCVWQTPGSPQNTCPALVRIDGKLKLVITTAVEHMRDEAKAACPNAGRIFVADVDLVDTGEELSPRYPVA